MRIIKALNKNEIEQALEDFYQQFETGFDFEDFLKPFLESLGLSQVEVTKKTGDGGIDLNAVKSGVVDGLDDVVYRVQAKRYKPSSRVSPSYIDALRGNLMTNQKGLFITTGKVSKNAKSDGYSKDPTRPVIVIDGEELINKLIDRAIGFGFKPVFSKDALKDYIDCEVRKKATSKPFPTKTVSSSSSIKKTITTNDIRAYIISIPGGIITKMKDNKTKRRISATINGKKFDVTFCPGRNYLAGVTKIFREFGLIKSDGTFEEKVAYWNTDGDSISFTIS